jgi:hypothetical protein
MGESKGTYFLSDGLQSEPKPGIVEVQNNSAIITFGPTILQTSYFDEEKRKYFVMESKDDGKTWVTIREYDSKDWIIKA